MHELREASASAIRSAIVLGSPRSKVLPMRGDQKKSPVVDSTGRDRRRGRHPPGQNNPAGTPNTNHLRATRATTTTQEVMTSKRQDTNTHLASRSASRGAAPPLNKPPPPRAAWGVVTGTSAEDERRTLAGKEKQPKATPNTTPPTSTTHTQHTRQHLRPQNRGRQGWSSSCFLWS